MSEFFFNTPLEFQKLLSEKGLIEEMYKSLEHDDKGDAVVTALKLLNKSNKMPVIRKVPEDEAASQFFRQLADQTLEEEDYSNAFDLYNQALRCAPKNRSDEMFEAYFGRAKLLFLTRTCWSACIADIDKCLKWNHPQHQSKLKQMKAHCQSKLRTTPSPRPSKYIDDFFNIKNHSKVPNVSAAVDFVIENGQPQVVAAKSIPIGKVVALETAYALHLDEENQFHACHFCHAFTLNFVPCDSCRYILFCSEECKKLCWKEYHNVECHIIHLLDVINSHNVVYPLALKAALKLKNLCTWEEFNAISLDLGLKPTKCGFTNEIYDVKNKLSILRCNNDRHFVFGQSFNMVFVIATIVHYLKSVPSFFPTDTKGKNEAIKSLGRVLVHLSLARGNIIRIPTATKNATTEDMSTLQIRNYGLFSFTSKLKHACDPNLYVVGLNNKVALITVKPIKRGEELTVSYVGHWRDLLSRNRSLELFTWAEITCRCPVCVEQWSAIRAPSAKMTENQKQLYGKWTQLKCAFFLGMAGMDVMYNETCNCINAFQNTPNTKEHKDLFDELKRIFLLMQFERTQNCTYLDEFKNTVLKLK